MSDFELGMMAGWAAGVITAGAVAGTLDWWRGRNRVVTIHTTSQPCDPAGQGDTLGADAIVVSRGPVILCPTCKGVKEVPFSPERRGVYRGPRTMPCGCCKGMGVIKAPPKKP